MAAAGTLAMVAERAVRIVTGFLFLLLAARELPETAFGLLVFSQTLVLMATALAGMGLDGVLPRALMGQTDRARVLAAASGPRLASGMAAALAVVAAALLLQPAEAPILMVLAPMALAGIYSLHEQVLLTAHRQAALGLVRLGLGLGFFALKAGLLLSGVPVTGVAAAIMAESLAAWAVLSWLSRRQLAGPPRRRPGRRERAVLVRRGLPLVVSSAVLMLFTYTDQMLLRLLIGPVAVGEYALGTRFTEAWIMLVSTFALALVPKLTAEARRLKPAEAPMLGLGLEIAIGASVLWIGICWLAVPALLDLVTGDRLEAAASVAVTYAAVAPFAAMRLVSGKWFVARDLTRVLARRAAVGLAVNAAAGLVLIPLMGVVGAAVSTLVAYVFVGLLADLLHPASQPMVAVKLRSLLLLRVLARVTGRGA